MIYITRYMFINGFYLLTITAKHVWQGSDYAFGLLKLLCCGSNRDTLENWFMLNIYFLQTKDFPLFWGHTFKYNIQAEKGQSTIKSDVFVFCFIFFIPLSQTICAINISDRTHQMKKTAVESQRERNALTCFNKKVQINNIKMETFSFHPPAYLPLF